jgi:hypothetical protein
MPFCPSSTNGFRNKGTNDAALAQSVIPNEAAWRAQLGERIAQLRHGEFTPRQAPRKDERQGELPLNREIVLKTPR